MTFPGLSSFVDIANNSFTREQLFQTEVYILQALDHRIAMPTVHRFLGLLVEGLQLDENGSALAAYLMVSVEYCPPHIFSSLINAGHVMVSDFTGLYVQELAVIETCTVTQPPSTTALAAAIIAGTLTESKSAISFFGDLEPPVVKAVNIQMSYLRRLYERAYDEEDQMHYTHVMKEKYDKSIWQCVPLSAPGASLMERRFSAPHVDACSGSPASTHSSAASDVDMLCIEA